jgi:hypothetical protein
MWNMYFFDFSKSELLANELPRRQPCVRLGTPKDVGDVTIDAVDGRALGPMELYIPDHGFHTNRFKH